MPVSAKFVVARNTQMGWASEIELVPDYSHGRNKEWAEATPAGMIRMTVKNAVAAEQFPTGRPKVILFYDENDPALNEGSGSY